MVSKKLVQMAHGNSAIRAMFEEGKEMAKKYGADKVYDFSIGNPNVPAPEAVKKAIYDILENEDPLMVHGYMSNSGYEDVREAVAQSLNRRFGTDFTSGNIIMTVGAAGGLNVAFKTILDPRDEVIVFAPYFVDYGNYVKNYDGNLVVVEPTRADFQLDAEELEKHITPKTKAIIINSPHNPTGVIYSEDTIKSVAAVLEKKQKEYGTSIFIVSDEPYRELAYDGAEVPYITKYYRNTIVGYSWSKSLSLPGERIGYIVIPSEIDDYEMVFTAAGIVNRMMGFINAPSLMQRVVARCLDEKTDIAYYDTNRKLLYDGLTSLGYDCVKPQGAFYMWVKTPCDDKEFVTAAKKYQILIVPGTSFAAPGYVRISYCVAAKTIENAMPGFKKLAEEYGLRAK